jgi:penicillin-binding protein 2
MATLLNGGTMYRPRLVAHIDNVRTGERRYLEPELIQQVALKPEHVEFVKRAMAGVNKEGTGARAFAKAEYTSGGKTGTAQVIAMKQNEKYEESKVAERFRDHSLFIAFAPVESPRIALAVVVENGGFGARAAAPIARAVLDYFLLGKTPAGMDPAPEDEDAEQEGND